MITSFSCVLEARRGGGGPRENEYELCVIKKKQHQPEKGPKCIRSVYGTSDGAVVGYRSAAPHAGIVQCVFVCIFCSRSTVRGADDRTRQSRSLFLHLISHASNPRFPFAVSPVPIGHSCCVAWRGSGYVRIFPSFTPSCNSQCICCPRILSYHGSRWAFLASLLTGHLLCMPYHRVYVSQYAIASTCSITSSSFPAPSRTQQLNAKLLFPLFSPIFSFFFCAFS